MPIATIKKKTALYLGNKIYAPQKSFVNAVVAAVAAAVHDRLVTLTCARQQTNTPNTHITLLQFTGAFQCCLHAVRVFCRAFWEVGQEKSLLDMTPHQLHGRIRDLENLKKKNKNRWRS